jgi:DNA-binding transcriptional LysR family regulator
MLYGARSYLDRAGRPQQRPEIARRHLISYQERVTYVEGFAWLATLGAPVSFRASDTLALAEACAAGLGLAVLPCSVGDADPSLEAIACAGLCIEPIWMVVPQDLRQRLAVRLTLQWIARLFAEHRPPLSGGEASAAAPVA